MSRGVIELRGAREERAWMMIEDAVLILTGSSVMYVMVVDPEGRVGHILTPDHEKETLDKLTHYKWESLRRLVEEHV